LSVPWPKNTPAASSARAHAAIASPTLRAARARAPLPGARVWDNLAMNGRSKLYAFLVLCLMAGAGIFAALLTQHRQGLQPLATGLWLTPSRALPDFTLIDQQGRPFGPAQLRGHWSLLFFGYTNCPDLCPTTLTTLAGLNRRLRTESAALLPQVVFVSVDAARDTPQQLSRYVPYFDPTFLGVTAPDQATIEALAHKLGVAVIVNSAKDGNYTVDHSGELFVINPDARLVALLSGPFTLETLAHDVRALRGGRS
jgi:protein SCO1/2